MKREQWVERVTLAVANNVTVQEFGNILDRGCEFYVSGGKCNGYCITCPLQKARINAGIPSITEEPLFAPKKPEEDITMMFKYKNFTFNWKEVK